jgi:Protein of unknown function DUF262
MTNRPATDDQRVQLLAQRRKVDFDTYDVTVDELLRRVTKDRIDIAPVYQRQFRWDAEHQSRLVESVLLGIPVPPLFMATNTVSNIQNQWEVVDGLQRLLTLVNFAGDQAARKAAHLEGAPLHLKGLDKLGTFEGVAFDGLPTDIRTTFEDRPLKVVVLNDKSDVQVRYDLFERLNTGGIRLTEQEIRECVFRGPFIDLLDELTQYSAFRNVLVLPESRWKDGTPQDFALRFFAFHDRYSEFEHYVKEFLNKYIESEYRSPKVKERRTLFRKTFDFLAEVFPSGIKTRRGQTPVNLFEALSVGAALALQESPRLEPERNPTWVSSAELRALTTGATNSRPRVAGRIEYCRDRFLGRNVA